MLPLWLQYYAARSARYFRSSHLPLPALLLLLREIGQFQTGRDFLLMDSPQSAVFHPGTGMYLFYPKSHRQLASFDVRNFNLIHSVGLRYRDPLNPKSGVDSRIISGWMGVARLIESAVNGSPFFGKLQTIETSCRPMTRYEQTYGDADETYESTYDIWVQTRRSWTIGWEAEQPEWDAHGHAIDIHRWGSSAWLLRNFCRGQRILLARVKVERAFVYTHPGYQAELVHEIKLYPELADRCVNVYGYGNQEAFLGRPSYTLREKGRRTATTYGAIFPLNFLSCDGKVMNLPPHSEMQVSYR